MNPHTYGHLIFTNPTSHIGIISNVYKEFKKLDSREPNNPIKIGYTAKQNFSIEEYQMAEKHLRKCSTSLAIREMQFKTTLRYHLTPVRMVKIKYSDGSRCW